MRSLIDIVLGQIDQGVLDHLLGQLRALDHELDMKMQDVHAAQQQVSVWDRINIFTMSDAEFELKNENQVYKEIRHRHGEVVVQIKDLIRKAIYKDFSVALKIQAGEIRRAISMLKVEHRHGIDIKAHHYRIRGMDGLWKAHDALAQRIDEHYHFTMETTDAGQLLYAVYDEVLRRAGFID